MDGKLEIDISEYLNDNEIKEIVIDEVRGQIRKMFSSEKEAQRILSNISYQLVFNEVDKVIPNSIETIKSKTEECVKSTDFSFYVFRKADAWDKPSLAYKIMEDTVIKNKDVIEQKVIDSVTNKDFTNDVWDKFEQLGENFMSNIYVFVETMKNKTK